MEEREDSEYTHKEECPKCGSRDNLARYTDGHGFCFGCKHWEPPTDGTTTTRKPRMSGMDFLTGDRVPLKARGITQETCDKFGYFIAERGGVKYQVAPYFKGGTMVAQHLRTSKKGFSWVGEPKGCELFGQHIWRDAGKKIVITEGEIDCLTVSQLQNNKWPVVSLPGGAAGGKKAIQANLAWLERYDEVILMFDMDDAGTAAVAECAPLFTPGRCKVAKLPLKDANEMLMAERGAEVIEAMWGAKEFRPDGLVSFGDIIDAIEKPIEVGLPWWDQRLNDLTFGRRPGETYAFGAGTGVGKTDWLTQQVAHDIKLGLKVGLLFLESPVAELGKRVAGKMCGKLFHIPGEDWTVEELRSNVAKLNDAGTLYDSFGQADWETVRGHIRYMACSLGITSIYLDHLTALADTNNERGSIEQIMKEMAGMANELKIILHFVSHLATPEGKPHEEGGRVMIRHFKGSRAIGFWSHFMFGLERNQQAENPEERKVTIFRCLKDRYTGRATGKTLPIRYDEKTGLLHPCEMPDAETPFDDETPRSSNEKADF